MTSPSSTSMALYNPAAIWDHFANIVRASLEFRILVWSFSTEERPIVQERNFGPDVGLSAVAISQRGKERSDIASRTSVSFISETPSDSNIDVGPKGVRCKSATRFS